MRLLKGLAFDSELLKKAFPMILDIKNANK